MVIIQLIWSKGHCVIHDTSLQLLLLVLRKSFDSTSNSIIVLVNWERELFVIFLKRHRYFYSTFYLSKSVIFNCKLHQMSSRMTLFVLFLHIDEFLLRILNSIIGWFVCHESGISTEKGRRRKEKGNGN